MAEVCSLILGCACGGSGLMVMFVVVLMVCYYFFSCCVFAISYEQKFAAVLFLFLTDQTRFVILILSTKSHVLIWVNSFCFEEFVCMMKWM